MNTLLYVCTWVFGTDLVWTWKPTVSTYRAFRRTLSQELRARGLTRRALAL